MERRQESGEWSAHSDLFSHSAILSFKDHREVYLYAQIGRRTTGLDCQELSSGIYLQGKHPSSLHFRRMSVQASNLGDRLNTIREEHAVGYCNATGVLVGSDACSYPLVFRFRSCRSLLGTRGGPCAQFLISFMAAL